MAFFFFFLILPIAEIYALYHAVVAWGFWNVFFLQVLISGLGIMIAKAQFQHFLGGFQNEIQKGRMPQVAMFHTGFKFIGGVFLAVPGLLTDIMGLLFLTPGVRHLLIAGFQKKVAQNMRNGNFRVFTFGAGPFGGGFKNYTYTHTQSWPREEREAQILDVTPLSSTTEPKQIE